jgi:hypothetical protein
MLTDFKGASSGEHVTENKKGSKQSSNDDGEKAPEQPYIRGIQVRILLAAALRAVSLLCI